MAKQPSELPQKRQRSNGNNSLIMNRSGLDLLNISTDSHMNLSQLALERQLDALRSEVQRERNARRLDKVKAEQMESRLKRQIQFLQEETEETRILLDNVRTQNEQDLEQMSQSRTEALQDLQDANETILQFQMQQQQQQYSNPDKNSDSLFWRQKCEYLTSELESSEQELQQLKEYNADRNNQKINNSLVDEENASISLNKSNLITHDDKSDSIMLSTAPPDVMKELHRTRVNLADTQRQHRLQSHKIKEMQKELKSAKSNLQLLASCQDKIILLERENKEFRNKQAMNEELENQWGQFRRDIEVYFNSNISSKIDNENKIHVVPSNDDDNIDKHKKHPPEIATIVRQFRNLQERLTLSQDEHYKTQALLSGSKKRVSHLESRIIEEEANVSSIQKQKEELDEKLLSCAMEIRKLKSQESISKNEVDSLRTILETFEFKPETPGKKTNLSSSSEATSRGLKLSLSRAEDKIKALSLSYDELKEKMNQTLDEKQALHTELERVKDKFGKLKDALMKEREKCENAEERAVAAEQLAGKGCYNQNTTRVLHLQDNPLTTALHDKYTREINKLKAQIEELKKVDSPAAKSESSQSFSKKSPSSAMSTLDAQKLHQRLKESFKEQISLFREGVYLLTGYKIDMMADSDKPLFKVRSMYAEKEEDHLMFMWPQCISDYKNEGVTSLDLLDSELAQELSITEAFGYMTKYKSIPAFMGSLTLSLFEKQTFAG